MIRKTGLCILGMLTILHLSAQPLSRLANKGLGFEPMTEERAKELGVKTVSGVYVSRVVPGMTAEALQVKTGDVLLKINNRSVNSLQDVLVPELRLHEGDEVTMTIIRNGKEKTLKGKAIGNLRENPGGLSLKYSSFPFKNGHISSMYLQTPVRGKKPAVLFIPGLSCISLDNMWEHHVYRKLIYGLAEQGYLVMRAEKPGMGDCAGTPLCEDIDFQTEVDAFRAALAALKKHPDVDTNNIFIIGHSMGAMEAPFVARGNNVRGIIAMGLTVKSWLEYLTEMLRIQNPRLGIDYLQNEADLKLYERLLYELLVNKKTPDEMANLNPDYERIMRRDLNYEGGRGLLTRDIVFSQTLNDVNIADAWLQLDCKVLAAWGETDIQVLNDFSHRELVRMINTYHPGNATFLELTDTDHNFLTIPTMEESYQRNADGSLGSIFPTHFNQAVITEFHKWMQNVIVL